MAKVKVKLLKEYNPGFIRCKEENYSNRWDSKVLRNWVRGGVDERLVVGEGEVRVYVRHPEFVDTGEVMEYRVMVNGEKVRGLEMWTGCDWKVVKYYE